MPTLHPDLRGTLEKTVCDARDIAEQGARAALEALAVGEAEPYKHLTPDQRDFRNRLRARGRQLGDLRDERKGTQEITRLVRQCAYEYWHRMLFARFLAENNLLMHPEGVAVSLEECEELAAEEGIDAWTLASRYAARMLPQIFRPDDVLLQITFALEHKQALEQLLAALPSAVFTASDSLGWVYQFWQAKRKKEVNDSGNKIGADELPAVTQLFTEDYMVDFLLQNTLGAWWVGHHPTEPLPVEMPYLRFVEDPSPDIPPPSPSPDVPPPHYPTTPSLPHPTPAAGTFPGWPTTAKELRILDPCCGSGHFLVAEFNLLVPMRMQEEGLSAQAACDAVLRDNLFGLEIDERCTQIAAFALAMAAWTYPGAGGYRQLPKLNIACSGIAISAKREDWLALAGDDMQLQLGMARLYLLFKDAPTIGSLINPQLDRLAMEADFNEIEPFLEKALKNEDRKSDYVVSELGVAAQGITLSAKILSDKYDLVITNVPYLGSGKQSSFLKDFIVNNYYDGRRDLATAFIQQCQQLCKNGGTYSLVTPHNWLFLGSYKKLRQESLKDQTWNLLARLGVGAFQTISGEVVNVILFTATNAPSPSNHTISGLDVSEVKDIRSKADSLIHQPLQIVEQANQLNNPDARIVLEQREKYKLLSEYADSYWGQGTGDFVRFGRNFWEIPEITEDWELMQSTVQSTVDYGGREHIVFWERGSGKLVELAEKLKLRLKNIHYRGSEAWSKLGVAVSQMRDLPVTLYTGQIFDGNCAAIVPKNSRNVLAIWAFCLSPEFNNAVRKIDQSLKVTNASLIKVPFDLDYWQQVAKDQYPEGLPKPYSEDPTQWIFHGKVISSTEPLQVAVARLVDYHWPKQTDESLDGLADDDGIVCIPSIRNEQPASERLRNLLVKAYGKDWTSTKLRELLEPDGYADKGLDDWLRNYFFEKHCKVFQHRPFIWHIWDGLKDGFAALVNYHKLDYKGLETLAYTYLGDWIRDQQAAAKAGTSGADNKLLKAQQLQKKLALILQGEAPYDIFVRWKPLDQQPIGWHPDLNDGVRLNIRPFIQAGVLRKNPNIKWNKDRGKNPPDSPWGEDRNNDIHLTLEQKRQAQEAPQP